MLNNTPPAPAVETAVAPDAVTADAISDANANADADADADADFDAFIDSDVYYDVNESPIHYDGNTSPKTEAAMIEAAQAAADLQNESSWFF